MSSFEDVMLPHLASAYNLARWILRNDHDAQDAVQDAYVRAFRNFSKFRGDDGRPWLLTVVRNTCYSRLRRERGGPAFSTFDEAVHGVGDESLPADDPTAAAAGAEVLRAALEALPEPLREMIVLHDLEGLAYREMAEVLEIPIGTVMSRLSRARRRLQTEVLARMEKENRHES